MKRSMSLLVAFGFCAGLICATPAFAEDAKGDKKKADPEVVFKKKDKDENGKLSFEEFKGKAEGKKAEKAEKRFKKLDKDGDSALSLEEFKAGVKKKKDA